MVNKHELNTSQETNGNYLLEIKDFTKKYGDFIAVNDIDLQIKKGEFLTLLGGSGSGKTTTLMAVAGFNEPTNGDILIDGQSILNIPPYRRNIGMVFQHYSLFPHMNVFENVAFPLRRRKYPKAEIKEKTMATLKLVELDQFAKRKPNELSGGQQQRVALARSLVFEPSILLMDEPLAALDKRLRESLQMEIRRLHQELGLTIIYVTHDQEEAIKMSDRIAIFDKGNIEQIGTSEELYNQPKNKFIAEFLGDSNIIKGYVAKNDKKRVELINDAKQKVSVATENEYALETELHMMIRPENINLHLKEALDSIEQENALEVTLDETIFLGDSYLFILTLPTGEGVQVKKQQVDEQLVKLKPNSTLYTSWKADDVVLF